MRKVAVVPARMGSERLPGKMMREIAGKPVIGHLLDRLAHCRSIDDIVVATSINDEDDAIARYCDARSALCFRGSDTDVLDRLLRALESQRSDIGVLVFGDNLLIDPKIVDEFVGYFDQAGGVDFVSNDLTTTYPPGMEVEVFRVSALRQAAASAVDPEYREHGTLFIRRHPDAFRLVNIEAQGDLRRPSIELELDTIEDIEVIEAVLSHFGDRTDFSIHELISFMDANPDIAERNQAVQRRWKEYRNDPRAD